MVFSAPPLPSVSVAGVNSVTCGLSGTTVSNRSGVSFAVLRADGPSVVPTLWVTAVVSAPCTTVCEASSPPRSSALSISFAAATSAVARSAAETWIAGPAAASAVWIAAGSSNGSPPSPSERSCASAASTPSTAASGSSGAAAETRLMTAAILAAA